jgi:hypothetical protein
MAPMVVVVVTPLTSKNHTSPMHPSHPYTDATMSSSLDHTIRNDDTVPYIMMLSMDMVMERRACLALAKRSTRT